jgi:hypothetical protein
MYTTEILVKYLHFPLFYGGFPDYRKSNEEDARPSELKKLSESLDELKALPEDFTGNFKGIVIEGGVPILINTDIHIGGNLSSVYFDIKALNGDLSHLKNGDYIHLLHEKWYDDDGDPTEYASISMCKIEDAELAIATSLEDGVYFIEESGEAEEIEDYL